MITAYALKLRDGRIVVGAIQGCGGLVGGGVHNEARIRLAIARANAGKRLDVYEPQAGHVLLYPSATAADAGPSELVDLRGARLLEVL